MTINTKVVMVIEMMLKIPMNDYKNKDVEHSCNNETVDDRQRQSIRK